MENKLLVMIMCGGDNPTGDKYNAIEESIINTWFQQKNNLVKIIIYKYENVTEITFDEEKRILKIPYGESLLGTGLDKTIRAFEWVGKNIKFDFLIRCNAGSFIDVDEALRFIQTKQSKKLYCGQKINKFNNADPIITRMDIQYVQGSCILFSQDIIQIFNRNDYFLDYCEDVSIGLYLTSKGITIDDNCYRINICDEQLSFVENSIDSERVEYYYHFRLRSYNNRELDIKSMEKLWYNKTNGQFPIYI